MASSSLVAVRREVAVGPRSQQDTRGDTTLRWTCCHLPECPVCPTVTFHDTLLTRVHPWAGDGDVSQGCGDTAVPLQCCFSCPLAPGAGGTETALLLPQLPASCSPPPEIALPRPAGGCSREAAVPPLPCAPLLGVTSPPCELCHPPCAAAPGTDLPACNCASAEARRCRSQGRLLLMLCLITSRGGGC